MSSHGAKEKLDARYGQRLPEIVVDERVASPRIDGQDQERAKSPLFTRVPSLFAKRRLDLRDKKRMHCIWLAPEQGGREILKPPTLDSVHYTFTKATRFGGETLIKISKADALATHLERIGRYMDAVHTYEQSNSMFNRLIQKRFESEDASMEEIKWLRIDYEIRCVQLVSLCLSGANRTDRTVSNTPFLLLKKAEQLSSSDGLQYSKKRVQRVTVYHSFAGHYKAMKKYYAALQMANKAVQGCSALPLQDQIPFAFFAKACLHGLLDDPSNAIVAYRDCLSLLDRQQESSSAGQHSSSQATSTFTTLKVATLHNLTVELARQHLLDDAREVLSDAMEFSLQSLSQGHPVASRLIETSKVLRPYFVATRLADEDISIEQNRVGESSSTHEVAKVQVPQPKVPKESLASPRKLRLKDQSIPTVMYEGQLSPQRPPPRSPMSPPRTSQSTRPHRNLILRPNTAPNVAPTISRTRLRVGVTRTSHISAVPDGLYAHVLHSKYADKRVLVINEIRAYQIRKRAAQIIQYRWRRALKHMKHEKRRESAASLVGSIVKMHTARRKYLRVWRCVSRVQQVWRSVLLRSRRIIHDRSAAKIQRVWKLYYDKKQYDKALDSVIIFQAHLRGAMKRQTFNKQRQAIIKIQAYTRQFIASESYKRWLAAASIINRTLRGMHGRRIVYQMQLDWEAFMLHTIPEDEHEYLPDSQKNLLLDEWEDIGDIANIGNAVEIDEAVNSVVEIVEAVEYLIVASMQNNERYDEKYAQVVEVQETVSGSLVSTLTLSTLAQMEVDKIISDVLELIIQSRLGQIGSDNVDDTPTSSPKTVKLQFTDFNVLDENEELVQAIKDNTIDCVGSTGFDSVECRFDTEEIIHCLDSLICKLEADWYDSTFSKGVADSLDRDRSTQSITTGNVISVADENRVLVDNLVEMDESYYRVLTEHASITSKVAIQFAIDAICNRKGICTKEADDVTRNNAVVSSYTNVKENADAIDSSLELSRDISTLHLEERVDVIDSHVATVSATFTVNNSTTFKDLGDEGHIANFCREAQCELDSTFIQPQPNLTRKDTNMYTNMIVELCMARMIDEVEDAFTDDTVCYEARSAAQSVSIQSEHILTRKDTNIYRNMIVELCLACVVDEVEDAIINEVVGDCAQPAVELLSVTPEPLLTRLDTSVYRNMIVDLCLSEVVDDVEEGSTDQVIDGEALTDPEPILTQPAPQLVSIQTNPAITRKDTNMYRNMIVELCLSQIVDDVEDGCADEVFINECRPMHKPQSVRTENMFTRKDTNVYRNMIVELCLTGMIDEVEDGYTDQVFLHEARLGSEPVSTQSDSENVFIRSELLLTTNGTNVIVERCKSRVVDDLEDGCAYDAPSDKSGYTSEPQPDHVEPVLHRKDTDIYRNMIVELCLSQVVDDVEEECADEAFRYEVQPTPNIAAVESKADLNDYDTDAYTNVFVEPLLSLVIEEVEDEDFYSLGTGMEISCSESILVHEELESESDGDIHLLLQTLVSEVEARQIVENDSYERSLVPDISQASFTGSKAWDQFISPSNQEEKAVSEVLDEQVAKAVGGQCQFIENDKECDETKEKDETKKFTDIPVETCLSFILQEIENNLKASPDQIHLDSHNGSLIQVNDEDVVAYNQATAVVKRCLGSVFQKKKQHVGEKKQQPETKFSFKPPYQVISDEAGQFISKIVELCLLKLVGNAVDHSDYACVSNTTDQVPGFGDQDEQLKTKDHMSFNQVRPAFESQDQTRREDSYCSSLAPASTIESPEAIADEPVLVSLPTLPASTQCENGLKEKEHKTEIQLIPALDNTNIMIGGVAWKMETLDVEVAACIADIRKKVEQEYEVLSRVEKMMTAHHNVAAAFVESATRSAMARHLDLLKFDTSTEDVPDSLKPIEAGYMDAHIRDFLEVTDNGQKVVQKKFIEDLEGYMAVAPILQPKLNGLNVANDHENANGWYSACYTENNGPQIQLPSPKTRNIANMDDIVPKAVEDGACLPEDTEVRGDTKATSTDPTYQTTGALQVKSNCPVRCVVEIRSEIARNFMDKVVSTALGDLNLLSNVADLDEIHKVVNELCDQLNC